MVETTTSRGSKMVELEVGILSEDFNSFFHANEETKGMVAGYDVRTCFSFCELFRFNYVHVLTILPLAPS